MAEIRAIYYCISRKWNTEKEVFSCVFNSQVSRGEKKLENNHSTSAARISEFPSKGAGKIA